MSELLAEKIGRLRSRDRLVSAGGGLAWVVVIGVGGVLASMGLDWLLELPLEARVLLAIMFTGGAAWVGYLRVWRVLTTDVEDDELALWIERENPVLRSRLISALQLSRGGAGGQNGGGGDPGLIAALVRETEEMLGGFDPVGLVKGEAMVKAGLAAAAVLVAMTLAVGVRPEVGVVLLQRALCVPGVEPLRKTRIELLVERSLVAAVGEDVTLRARAFGVIPDKGYLTQTLIGGGSQVFDLPKVEGRDDEFALTIKGVTQSFEARVLLNDAASQPVEVSVRARPEVKELQVWATPPRYVRGSSRKPQENVNDVMVLAGSVLDFRVVSTKPLALTSALRGEGLGQSRVVFVGTGGGGQNRQAGAGDGGWVVGLNRALGGNGGGGTALEVAEARGVAIPPGAVGFQVYLMDADGLESKDPMVYRLDVIPDAAPRVTVQAPRAKEEVVTRQAEVRIRFEAEDDVGLAALRVRYEVTYPMVNEGDTARKVSGKVELNVTAGREEEVGGGGKLMSGYYPWSLPTLGQLPEGTTVEWYLEAEDGNTLTGPGVARSERFLTRIGTAAQVKDALMARLGNSFGTLEGTQESQRELARDLGKLVTEKPLGK